MFSMRIVWVSTESRTCGIADYSKVLWSPVQAALKSAGVEGIFVSLDQSRGDFKTYESLKQELLRLSPEGIHFQHEYGIWGGKNPPYYWFPRLIRSLRKNLPQSRLTATAHTVLSREYRFPLKRRGWEVPFRVFANCFLLKRLWNLWGERTWGELDGVVVHSCLQKSLVEQSGCKYVEVIPHFVAQGEFGKRMKSTAARDSSQPKKTVLVFGFFTPEKGQDIAIEALAKLPADVRMILAGGIRRKKDESYFNQCMLRARELGISDRLEMTGFVDSNQIDDLYMRANLVLAPCRETSGSGSLAQALARGGPVLASDLSLNREIAERESEALTFFRAGDASDCAKKMLEILENEEISLKLQKGARRYAEACLPALTAEKHLRFFRSVGLLK